MAAGHKPVMPDRQELLLFTTTRLIFISAPATNEFVAGFLAEF